MGKIWENGEKVVKLCVKLRKIWGKNGGKWEHLGKEVGKFGGKK